MKYTTQQIEILNGRLTSAKIARALAWARLKEARAVTDKKFSDLNCKDFMFSPEYWNESDAQLEYERAVREAELLSRAVIAAMNEIHAN